jgi:hypothetical protein
MDAKFEADDQAAAKKEGAKDKGLTALGNVTKDTRDAKNVGASKAQEKLEEIKS